MNNDTIKLLKLEESIVEEDSIYVEIKDNITYVHFKLINKTNCCSYCGSVDFLIHSYRTRKLNYGLYLKSKCFLMYKARRFKCRDCGHVFYEYNPFAPKCNRITQSTKLSVLDDLRDFHQTFKSVADKYFISSHEVLNIFDDYINCEPKKLPEITCCDEFYKGRKAAYKYAFVMLDFSSGDIVDVVSSRHKETLIRYFSYIPKSERNNVKYLVIDMYDTYRDVLQTYFSKAVIAVDSFHVIQHLTKAMDSLRVFIMNKFDKKNKSPIANDTYYYFLKKFHYFFTKNYDNIYNGYIKVPKLRTVMHKSQILEYLLTIDDNLTKGYILIEKYKEFNRTTEIINEDTEYELDKLISEFISFGFGPFSKVGKMMKRWKKEILNSFTYIKGRRLSNGPIEGANSRIKVILKNACGINDFNRLRNRIMFSINKNTPIQYKK